MIHLKKHSGLILVLILLQQCTINKMTLPVNHVESIGCKNFYLYAKHYKSNLPKNTILQGWRNQGFTLMDTTIIEERRWMSETKLLNIADTIHFVNFQLYDGDNNHTSIYLHGICLRNEKMPNKKQKELKALQKQIEKQFLENILVPK